MDLSENLESTSTERHLTRGVHLQILSFPNTQARMGRGFEARKKEMTENGLAQRAYDGRIDIGSVGKAMCFAHVHTYPARN